MIQAVLPNVPQVELPGQALGRGYRLVQGPDKVVALYSDRVLVRRVDFSDGLARRLFVVELVREYGLEKMAIHRATGLSRQTIDNWLSIVERWGVEGLIHSSRKRRGGAGEAIRERAAAPELGNKARLLEEERRRKGEEQKRQQMELAFGGRAEDPAFGQTHSWRLSRYAGALIYRAVLEHTICLSQLLSETLGKGAMAVWLFIMMLVQQIPSVEQLKTVVPEEFGPLLGLNRLPSKSSIWSLLTGTYWLGRAKELRDNVFRRQLLGGIVGLRLLYVDGHFLPYTGSEPVRYAYSTKRGKTFPGRMVYVTKDANRRIVYFEIHEGPGDLHEAIRNLGRKVRSVLPEHCPLLVVDREMWSVPFFGELDGSEHRQYFVTWERYTPKGELEGIADESFGPKWTRGEIQYRVYEREEHGKKTKKTYRGTNGDEIALRRVVIWNLTTGKRTACVTNQPDEEAESIAYAMVGRWGVSENGMKRLVGQWNFDYTPGYRIEDSSADQTVPNPELRDLDRELARVRRKRSRIAQRLCRMNARARSSRKKPSGKHRDLQEEFDAIELEITSLQEKKRTCPERVCFSDIRGEELKRIDEESKTLFGVAEQLAQNAERLLLKELEPHYHDPRDPLVVLRMVAACHGRVRVTDTQVQVQLEPLHQLRYRAAQQGLLARLNSMRATVGSGKRLVFEVLPATEHRDAAGRYVHFPVVTTQ